MLKTGKAPYVQGTAAEKIKYDVYEENKVLKAKKTQKSSNKAKLKIVLTIMISFMCCLTVICRYAQITEMNYKIIKTTNEYNAVRNENSRLKVDIEKKLDIQTLKDTAEQKLGMQKPDRYQVIRVSIPKTDYTQVADEYKAAKNSNGTVLSQLMDKVGKFCELIY